LPTVPTAQLLQCSRRHHYFLANNFTDLSLDSACGSQDRQRALLSGSSPARHRWLAQHQSYWPTEYRRLRWIETREPESRYSTEIGHRLLKDWTENAEIDIGDGDQLLKGAAHNAVQIAEALRSG
jgi:hypothetical protein